MARWGMVFDLKRCIGCNACVVACRMENELPNGVFFTRTFVQELGTFPQVRRIYVPTLCNHCTDAPCEKVCPSGATYTREDGIVMVDQGSCIGCGACAVACPYDARIRLPRQDADGGDFERGEAAALGARSDRHWPSGTVTKCDFCSRRVDGGQLPACVAVCPTEARIFGDFEDPNSAPNLLIRRRNGRPPLPEKNTRPNVYYVD